MAKAKVAIIEDDVAIVQMYRMKFEAEGYQVATAGDGEAGLQVIETASPDIILLDLNMPQMDGETMLKKLRKQEWGKDLKVIILTNIGASEAPSSISKLGVKDFIVKAELTPKQVVDRVKQILST